MIWIKNSDVQIFQIYGHTTRIPDFRVNGPSENRLKSDMSDSPDFYISEIRGDRFTDFCVHTARLSGNRLQKVGRLEKIGQWDHGISECLCCKDPIRSADTMYFMLLVADRRTFPNTSQTLRILF